MSLQSGAVAMGRRQAELRMRDTCEIRRVTGRALNETTGQYVDTFTVIYSGKCRLRYLSPRVFDVDSAAQALALAKPTLSIPVTAVGSGATRPNDVATITAVDLEVGDPALVGTKFRISGVHSQTAATARRFLVEVAA